MQARYARSESSVPPDRRFADWIRKQMLRRGWSNVELARRTGVSASRVSDWRTGKNLPSSHSSIKIADAFDVDPDLVLYLAGHREPPSPIPQDTPKARIIALIQRTPLTPAQEQGLESMIHSWLEFARASEPAPELDLNEER
jgi:transcriptional regulator with XRE-family HTH domain